MTAASRKDRIIPQVIDLTEAPRLPYNVTLTENAGLGDAVDLMLLERFTTGEQPFARTRSLENVLPDAPLTPPTATVVRDLGEKYRRIRLAVGPGYTVHSAHFLGAGSAVVTVVAETAEVAERQVLLAVENACAEPSPREERVPVGFWHLAPNGPRRLPREIEVVDWERIRGNYSRSVARVVEPVMKLTPSDVGGRLLLLHGPPGTGKTTLLRALAQQWRDWCSVDCVLDPERLFGDPSYLLQVALDAAEDEEESRWRLLLLEDCDELISGEAKSRAGQALSRLLNLTDGLLGQGRNVLVAITTNEDLGRLHPAVVRPGRAMASIEVGRLPSDEARAWLAGQGSDAVVGGSGATLAELFALRSGATADEDHTPVGMYL